jgi:uncharacterized protein involved in exopolysaccharide biosynthesis
MLARSIDDPITENRIEGGGSRLAEGEISLLDVALVVWRRRRLLALVFGVGILLGVLIVLLTPVSYRSQTKVLSSLVLDSPADLGSSSRLRFMAGLSGLDLGGNGVNVSVLLPQMITSRDFILRLLRRDYAQRDGANTDLGTVLEIKGGDPRTTESLTVREVRQRLRAAYDFQSGITTISATFPDPFIASGVAEAVVQEINLLLRELRSSQLGDKARFISGRLDEVEDQLGEAEDALKGFRERNRQVGSSPHLMLQESRLARDVTVLEQVYLTLKNQLEIARIEEHKDISDVVVLEQASPPAEKLTPRRARIMAVTIALSSLGACLVVFMVEYARSWSGRLPGRRSSDMGQV